MQLEWEAATQPEASPAERLAAVAAMRDWRCRLERASDACCAGLAERHSREWGVAV